MEPQRCPVCERSLVGLTVSGRELHVNECLDESARRSQVEDEEEAGGGQVGSEDEVRRKASCSALASSSRRPETLEPKSRLARLVGREERGKEINRSTAVSLRGALRGVLKGAGGGVKKTGKPRQSKATSLVQDFGGQPQGRPRIQHPSLREPRCHRGQSYNHYGDCLQEFMMSSEDTAKEDPSSLLIHCKHGEDLDF
ncbi:hypothetical protein HOP50_06g43940 [Chloropicon primus]|uniref:Uncharacterized protein n=1 Tax=Chloropicon primus TaxID=1764295 RepID=A0A5B8MMW3_9CHLO|nr:hypothetical protein A3770_06p43710 [Chloropicon primus]UPR01073.1 hypothetical protein HOP50_06g43940 [Chloropicon primus]|eukprot:QDZ21853.1 hypothetical protein A3770_06p43710 [Chloropicon primus]